VGVAEGDGVKVAVFVYVGVLVGAGVKVVVGVGVVVGSDVRVGVGVGVSVCVIVAGRVNIILRVIVGFGCVGAVRPSEQAMLETTSNTNNPAILNSVRIELVIF
jgi:hypothetical protein